MGHIRIRRSPNHAPVKQPLGMHDHDWLPSRYRLLVCIDSLLYNKSRHPVQVTKGIASLLQASGDSISIRVPQSQLQEGSKDC